MEWRAAMGRFATGVTIVTSWDGDGAGRHHGQRLLLGLAGPAAAADLPGPRQPGAGPLEACGVFGVNILDADCGDLARRFGRDPVGGRFDDLEHHCEGGAPRLAVATTFIDCRVEQTHDAGDHRIVVGRGLRVGHHSEASPLLFHRGQFPRLA